MNPDFLSVGGIGCDLVTGTNEFTARKGYIRAIVVATDLSGITNIKEMLNGTETTITSRSYLGTNTLGIGTFIVPDFPVKKITLSAGSVYVYYGE